MAQIFELADHVVGFLVSDDIDKEHIKEIHREIDSRCKEHEKINLFIEIAPGTDFSISAFLKDIKFKTKHVGKFRKMAIVTDLDWFKIYSSLKDVFMESDIRNFSNDERLEAINWISH